MAVTADSWWNDILNMLEADQPGGRTSDASYYTGGKAQEGEWGHVITTIFERTADGSAERKALVDKLAEAGFWQPTDRLSFWYGTESIKPAAADVQNLATASEQRLPNIDWNKIGEAGTTQGNQPGYVAPQGQTGDGKYPGIMQGGTIHKVANPTQEDYYIVEYEYPPGSGHSFYYKATADELNQALGPNMGGGSYPVGAVVQESDLASWTNAGSASGEIVGVAGTFSAMVNDVVTQAAIDAGINDPTLLGVAINDPEIQNILAKSAISASEWTPERMKAELRKTNVYQTVLYPGIANFYGSSQNPEADYAMYKQNATASLKALGVAPDANGGYGSYMQGLLDAGVSDTALATFVPTYKKASTNVGYADALDKWTTALTGQSISNFEDWYDVLAGNSPQEIQDIAEMAGLQYAANLQNFAISDAELQAIGQGLDLDEAAAGQLFSGTARRLLALGESGLRRGGLTSSDVLMAEAGMGDNPEKIKLKMQKLAIEEGLVDDPSASFYTSYNSEGAPQKSGLQSTVNEGA